MSGQGGEMLKYNGGECISSRHLPPNQPTAGRVLCRLDLDSDRYSQEVESLFKILRRSLKTLPNKSPATIEIDINWQVLDSKE